MTGRTAQHIIGSSMTLQSKKKEGIDVSNIRDLREQAGMTAFELAAASDVSISTINRLEHGKVPVSKRLIYKVLNTLSDRLGVKVGISDVDGLAVKND